jgi:hypothetical protein
LPYTFSWTGSSSTTATAGSLLAGTYTVTVTDAKGCVVTQTVTITEPSLLTASTTKTDVSCNGMADGTATVIATGGTLNYTYSWSPVGGAAAIANGLLAGTYTATVTDAMGCTTTATAIITQPTVLASTATSTNVSCFGGNDGTASVTASGGTQTYTYSWSPSGGTSSTATGLTAGTYSVTVTDNHGCTSVSSVTITEPGTGLSATTGQTNVSCFGGNDGTAWVITAGGTSPYSYSWNPTAQTNDTATGLIQGNYT